MGRQLVICLDGTGNRFSHRPTNIIRIVRSLANDPTQLLSYYDQGVGTFGIKETLFEWQKLPSRIFGLAFGWGLKRTVEGAYTFLAQNYKQEDDIFIFGFSRGAFAARAVAALLRAVGLVAAHEAHLFDYAWAMLLARDGPQRQPDFELQARFKKTFGTPVNIRFLGLFDTVKSVGWIYDPVIIPYTADNPIVQCVRHAVSIDERRCFFRQHLWSPSHSPKTDLKEVWFAGVHSDIGGGYPPEQAQLALLAHRWMLSEAYAAGLKLDPVQTNRQLIAAPGVLGDCTADQHDSMTRAWKIAEWVPQRIWIKKAAKRSWHIGAMPPFGKPRPRVIDPGVHVHSSVETRIAGRPNYRPVNLPPQRSTVDDLPLFAKPGSPGGPSP